MKTYFETYMEIKPIETKVLTGISTKEESALYRAFLESDLYKEQIRKDAEAEMSVWDKCSTGYAVGISG